MSEPTAAATAETDDLKAALPEPTPEGEAMAAAMAQAAAGNLSPEERALILASASAKLLMRKEPYRQLVASMVAFRRAYAMAYAELQALLAAERPAPHPMAEDVLVQSAMHQAAQPFEENVLIRGFVETVMPWMAGVLDKHNSAEAAAREAERDAAEERRRASPVPAGVAWSKGEGGDALPRHRSVALVGWREPLLAVLRVVADHAAAKGYQVVHLADTPVTPKDSTALKAVVGSHRWRGCADTAAGTATLMGTHVAPLMGRPPDLVVVDDLTLAFTASFVGRHPGGTAGDAHKRLSSWCKAAGAALLVGVPHPHDDPLDPLHPAFEQLRTFAALRPLTVVDLAEGLAGRPPREWPEGASVAVQVGDGDTVTLPADKLADLGRLS